MKKDRGLREYLNVLWVKSRYSIFPDSVFLEIQQLILLMRESHLKLRRLARIQHLGFQQDSGQILRFSYNFQK